MADKGLPPRNRNVSFHQRKILDRGRKRHDSSKNTKNTHPFHNTQFNSANNSCSDAKRPAELQRAQPGNKGQMRNCTDQLICYTAYSTHCTRPTHRGGRAYAYMKSNQPTRGANVDLWARAVFHYCCKPSAAGWKRRSNSHLTHQSQFPFLHRIGSQLFLRLPFSFQHFLLQFQMCQCFVFWFVYFMATQLCKHERNDFKTKGQSKARFAG